MYSNETKALTGGLVGSYLMAMQMDMEREKMAQQERYQNSLMALNEAQGEYYRQGRSTQVNPMSSDDVLADYLQNPSKYSPQQIALIEKYKADKGIVGQLGSALNLWLGKPSTGSIGTNPTTTTDPTVDTAGEIMAFSPSENAPMTNVLGGIKSGSTPAGYKTDVGVNEKGQVSTKSTPLPEPSQNTMTEMKDWSSIYEFANYLEQNMDRAKKATGWQNLGTKVGLNQLEQTQFLTGGTEAQNFRNDINTKFSTIIKARGGTAVSKVEKAMVEGWWPIVEEGDVLFESKVKTLKKNAIDQLKYAANANKSAGYKDMPWDSVLITKPNDTVFGSSVPTAKQTGTVFSNSAIEPLQSPIETPDHPSPGQGYKWDKFHGRWVGKIKKDDGTYEYRAAPKPTR
jgi:hypothetical protein